MLLDFAGATSTAFFVADFACALAPVGSCLDAPAGGVGVVTLSAALLSEPIKGMLSAPAPKPDDTGGYRSEKRLSSWRKDMLRELSSNGSDAEEASCWAVSSAVVSRVRLALGEESTWLNFLRFGAFSPAIFFSSSGPSGSNAAPLPSLEM